MTFKDEMHKLLVKSIATRGQLVPITVEHIGISQRYRVIDGQQRLRAMRELNLGYVICRVLNEDGTIDVPIDRLKDRK